LNAPVQFFEYWYFHIPNYLLALVMYSLLARFLLSFVFTPDSKNYIYRGFVRVTDPALAVVRPLTPRSVPPLALMLFGAIWLLIARFVLLASLSAAGLAPTIPG
jgi:YggT family protein